MKSISLIAQHEGRESGDELFQVKTCMLVIRVNGEQITLLSDALVQENKTGF